MPDMKNYPLSTIHYPLIDIHTHILAGLDDGAKDIEHSLAMAEVAVKDGITMLVATPHVIKGVFDNSKDTILENVGTLSKCLESKGIPLRILPGAEYHLEPDLPRRMAAGELLTINDTGRYLLVELPSSMVPDYTGRVLYDLQLQGVTPIIAHPERNAGFEREPELLKNFISRGVLTQITSTSVTGLFGNSAKKTALRFIKEGFAHIIASDAHSTHGRSPRLSQAFQEIEHRWGTDYAQTLTSKNPRLIIEGHPVETCILPKKHSLWSRLLKKSHT